MQTTTTLRYKDKREGNSARGAWVLSIFGAGDGRDYTTLDPALASKIKENDGSLFVVDFTERPAKAGREQYGPDYSVTGVELAPEGAKAAPAAQGGGGKGEFRSPAQIIRTSALEFAVVSFGAAGVNGVEQVPSLLELAVIFEAYITEGIEEEPEA